MITATKYQVTITRDGKWWMVAIPELDGLTQARRIEEASDMAREYIAVTLDIPEHEVELDIEIGGVGGVTNIVDRARRIREEREKAAELEEQASEEARQLATELVAEHIPIRDVGAILGVSHQRASQLAAPVR